MRMGGGCEGRGYGSAGMPGDIRKIRRIRIEVARHLEAGQVLGRVRKPKDLIRDAVGNHAPRPGGTACSEVLRRPDDARRLLGPGARAIVGTPGIMEQEHCGGSDGRFSVASRTPSSNPKARRLDGHPVVRSSLKSAK
jgi:hypothetical protein